MPFVLFAQTSNERNGIMGIGMYGIGEIETKQSKHITLIHSTGLGYEFFLNNSVAIVPSIRHGKIRFEVTQDGSDAFSENLFVEATLQGRKYYSVGEKCMLYVGVQPYARWIRKQTIYFSGSDSDQHDLGWNFGVGGSAGVRFRVRPRTSIEVGIGETLDLFESYRNSEREMVLKQFSLNAGLVIIL